MNTKFLRSQTLLLDLKDYCPIKSPPPIGQPIDDQQLYGKVITFIKHKKKTGQFKDIGYCLSTYDSTFCIAPLLFIHNYPEFCLFKKTHCSPWSYEEKRIFIHQYVAHPKKFHKISNHLPFRSTKDCVKYYYMRKHGLALKQKIYNRAIYTPPLQKYKNAFSSTL